MPTNPYEPPKEVNEGQPARRVDWQKFAAISALTVIAIIGTGAVMILALGFAMQNDGF
jgi:hypothetical protein